MLRTPTTSLPFQSNRRPRTFIDSMLRNANNGDALNRRRARHDPGLVVLGMASNRSALGLQRKSCAGYGHEPESNSWHIPKLSHPHTLCSPSKLNMLRAVAVIAMPGPAQSSSKKGKNQRKRLRRLRVPPGNRFRRQNVESRLPNNAPSYRSRSAQP